MLTLLRRFVTMAALMVWQGGFIFYTAVVVPIGTAFLGTATRQGFITRQVTASMNVCGAIALGLMVWELAACQDTQKLRRGCRLALYVGMVGAAVALFVLHARLDALLDVDSESVLDRTSFRPLHRAYLWISSCQWVMAVIFLMLTLAGWQNEDRRSK